MKKGGSNFCFPFGWEGKKKKKTKKKKYIRVELHSVFLFNAYRLPLA